LRYNFNIKNFVLIFHRIMQVVHVICRRQLAQAADQLHVQFAFSIGKLSYEVFNVKINYAIFMQINIHNFTKMKLNAQFISINFIFNSQKYVEIILKIFHFLERRKKAFQGMKFIEIHCLWISFFWNYALIWSQIAI